MNRSSLVFSLVFFSIVASAIISSRQAMKDRKARESRGDEFARVERIQRIEGTVKILRSLNVLKKGLSDPSLRVRLAAVKKLTEVPGEEPTEFLKEALKDSSRSVSAQAYRALLDRGVRVPPPFPGAEFAANSEPIPPEILEGLDHEDLTERQVAIVSLKKFASPHQAATLLTKALSDPEVKIRYLACEEIARLPTHLATPPLQTASEDEDPRIRERATELLAEIARRADAPTAVPSPDPEP